MLALVLAIGGVGVLTLAQLAGQPLGLVFALLPATVTVIGLLVLGQVPTVRDLAGIALVILGVALHRDAPARWEEPATATPAPEHADQPVGTSSPSCACRPQFAKAYTVPGSLLTLKRQIVYIYILHRPGGGTVSTVPERLRTSPQAEGRIPQRGRGVPRGRKDRSRARRFLAPTLSVIIFLALWQLIGSHINPILLATPYAIARSFVQISANGTLGPAFLRALEVLIIGFGLAIVVGVGLGIWMGRRSTVERVINPYVNFFQATPLIALTPLVVIWFGIGLEAEVAITFLLAVWSIIINTTEGIKNTPSNLLDMARVYHATERSTIRHVAVPNALPYIFAGLRIGLAKALIGVIIGEMDVSAKGLGGLINNFGNAFQTAPLLAAIICSSIVGVIGTILIEMLRRWLAPWDTTNDARRRV